MSDTPRERFEALYREHYLTIFRTCLRRLGDRESAEDAAMEVFRVSWQHVREGHVPDISWLYTTARNCVGTVMRSDARAGALVQKAIVFHRDEATASDVDHSDLFSALSLLPEVDRELLILRYWEELPSADIGKILAIDVRAVDTRLSRARSRLRSSLALTRERAARG